MSDITYEQAFPAAKTFSESIPYGVLPASIVATLVAMASDNSFWFIRDLPTSVYSLPPNISTFSSFEENLVSFEISNAQKFEQKIASIYADFTEKQEPLEREFAAVWDANAEQLYES